jgi:hypothetical protein
MNQTSILPIRTSLLQIEQEFLAARDTWPRVGWVGEFTKVLAHLKRLYHELNNKIAQQDLTYQREHHLRNLRDRCIWLIRRICREVFFRLELTAERALRSHLPESAQGIYLYLIEIQDLDHEFGRLDDEALVERLLTEAPSDYTDSGVPPILR